MTTPAIDTARSTPVRRRPEILVVDDSALQRRVLRAALKSSAYEVREAASGEDALEACRESAPDIVVSDWMMPGMSGLDLCAALRREVQDDYVYFIMLTSKSATEDLAEALRAGADDFVSKPLSQMELAARIAAGDRILAMSRELREKNRLVMRTLSSMERMNERLEQDLAEARRLQLSLAPRGPVETEGGSAHFLLRPSGHVGGDILGTFPAGHGRIGLYSMDVSGHGIASALVTMRLSSWLSGRSPERNIALCHGEDGPEMSAPDVVCTRLNERFLAEYDTGHYFTMIAAEFDPSTGLVRYAQAGHPHPLHLPREGAPRLIGQGGPPVGLMDDMAYETCEVVLEPGDRLLIYSDGITECPAPDGTMLDDGGLVRLCQDNGALSGQAFLDALSGALKGLCDGNDPPDDVSAILIERR